MSTRSVIAVAHGDVWEGVYCHSSGYPTWLGPELWTTFHARHGGDIVAFEAQVIQAHRGGYSGYPDDCYCHVVGDPADADEEFYTPEDEEQCALLIEWVYVFSRRVLTVLKSVPTGKTIRREGWQRGYWMEPVYRWAMTQQIDLHGLEPDWDEVEARGKQVRDDAYRRIATAQVA
jgi:hypothetical protein